MDEMEVDEIGEFSKNFSQASLLVAFYNIQDAMSENGLYLLLELISGLLEANGDFRVEYPVLKLLSSLFSKILMSGHLLMSVMDTIDLSNFRFSQDFWNPREPVG